MDRLPNVLWIMTDQHHAGCMSGAGHPDVRTPHLDALARRGTRFDRAYCNNPICGPSRACFSSGQYPHTHGIMGNDIYGLKGTGACTLAEHFRRHGYQTALVGKGHLPREWLEAGYEYRRYSDLADGDAFDPRTVHYYDDLVRAGLGNDFDLGTLPESHPGYNWRSFVSKLPYEKSVEYWAGEAALTFLRERDRRRPFMLQLSFQRPHDPYAPSSEHASLYPPGELHLPDNSADLFGQNFAGKPQFQRDYVETRRDGCPFRPRDEDDLRVQLSRYLALVTVIDGEIGRVIAHLAETGELDNTIIAYHSDHGDFAGEHGLMLKNFGIYEAIHRIPFILSWPGGPQGGVDSQLVESVDLFPTLCALADLPIPERLDGRSLVAGDSSPLQQTVCEWDFYDSAQASTFAIRTATHRMVIYLANPADGELYNCEADPGEMRNLFHDAAHAELRWKLLMGIFSHTARYRRKASPSDEMKPNPYNQDGPTKLIHKYGHQWSEMAPFFEHVSRPQLPGSID